MSTNMAFASSSFTGTKLNKNSSFVCSSKLNRLRFYASKTSRSTFNASQWEMKFGIFYSSVTGNTEDVAQLVKENLGEDADEPVDIADTSPEKLGEYDSLVVGAPTWNTGADSERTGTPWDDFLYGDIEKTNLKDKNVAVFGLGDSLSYSETFCDALEEMHDRFQKAGAKMIGYTNKDSVEFDSSKSVRDGKFLGLAVDMVNDEGDAEERISNWCAQIKSESGR